YYLYTHALHDALPIAALSRRAWSASSPTKVSSSTGACKGITVGLSPCIAWRVVRGRAMVCSPSAVTMPWAIRSLRSCEAASFERSEEHTSELQSRFDL